MKKVLIWSNSTKLLFNNTKNSIISNINDERFLEDYLEELIHTSERIILFKIKY